jgi:hypothetical protein
MCKIVKAVLAALLAMVTSIDGVLIASALRLTSICVVCNWPFFAKLWLLALLLLCGVYTPKRSRACIGKRLGVSLLFSLVMFVILFVILAELEAIDGFASLAA